MSGKGKSKLSQSSKSTSSKKSRNKRDIISTPPYSEFPAATSTFSGLAILFSALLGFLGINNTYAASISVSISGEMNLNLVASDEGMFGTSTPTTISVVSSNSSGYTLTLTGNRSDGKLVGSNPNNYFTSIAGPLTDVEFNTPANNGKWGILPSKYNSADNTSYQTAPTNTNPVTMDTTNTANYSPNTYTLAVAARASTSAGSMSLADEYTGTFTLAATGNAIDYDIAYADANNNMPGLTYGASSTGMATISNDTPTREGYNFGGWCTVSVTIGESCTSKGGTVIAKGGDYTLSSGDNNVTLYAIWNPVTFAEAFGSTAMNMQNMTSSICNAVAIGQEATLTDARTGNKTYRVGKMKDGKCWMLDNLALGTSTTITLTPDNTNISANYTLPATRTDGFTVYNEPRINIAYNATVPQGDDPLKDLVVAGQWKVGTYYNYCAASAGSYCPASGAAAGPVNQDICPKGWRMPSGGPGGEYQVIYDAYGNNYTNFRTALHLPLSGHYYSAQVYGQGSNGHWWSSTFYNGNNMYNPYSGTSGIDPQNANTRYYGFSMRCVAK